MAALLLATVVSGTCFATPAAANPLADMWNGIVAFFSGDAGVEAAAAGDESTTADSSTLTAWESHLSPDGASTQNIGRIWTDKTVADESIKLFGGASMTVDKGSSDFVVGLSALSSMSSITNEIPKPLDIVLVLDTSSSMLREIEGEPQYVQIDGDDVTSETGQYWIRVNGEYKVVIYNRGVGYWYVNGSSTYYRPEGGPAGQYPNYSTETPFYTIKNSRLAALKTAVGGFADAMETANADMPDGQKHEIALVRYSNNERSEIVSTFTDDTDALKNTVNSLTANGSTQADTGVKLAKQVLDDDARQDSRKVVIFFTDGAPSDGTNNGAFSDTIANAAIQTGSDMNSKGTLLYTVGVFPGADPKVTDVVPGDDTTKFNAYMHGMSSNYPFAQSYDNLGDRVGTREYYKVAEDEAGLAQVFQEIASELKTEMSDSPLSSGGAGGERGYLTFADELGKYMEADSVKSIVFANQQFTQSSSTTNDNTHATTYVFDQEVTDSTGIFPNGNLNQIIIEVQKYPDDLAKGDTVTVKIPANLIPLRNYQASVDKEGKVTWQGVTEAYPVRVFYGVSLKADAAAAIKSGTTGNAETDAALKAYIEANTSEVNGHKSVNFLSNLFEGTPGEGSGTTMAKFTPADSNGYYYVQEDTPLYVYTDEEPADVANIDPVKLVPLTRASYDQYNPTNVYYKQTVYKEHVDQAVDEIVAIPLDKFTEGVKDGMVAGGETDGAYLVKGSPRLSRIREFEDVKGKLDGSKNNTDTAALAVNPNWDDNAAGSGITVQLGNNGKLSVELPGELHVSKEVTVADGLDKDQFNNTEFSFTVNVAGMANQKVWAQVVNTNGGAAVGGKTEISLDGQGNYTTTLKDGQTLVLTGLNDGATYTVTETLPQNNGFTQSSEGDTGTISSSTPAEAKFTNHYAVTQTTVNDINAQKKFTDADTVADMAWDGATFDFVIEAQLGGTDDEGNKTGSYDGKGNAINNVADIPMPDGATNGVKHQTVTSSDTFDFGSINYTKPGTYVYHVWERTPDTDADDWLAGVAYSAAVYHVQIVVKDNGQGALYIDDAASTMYMEIEDDGDELTTTDKVDTAVIANTYKKATAQAQFRATKIWKDTTGSRALADSQFGFVLEATGGTAKDGSAIDVADVPTLTSNATVPNSGTSVSWGNIEFTNAMEGNTYTYKLYEYQPTVDGKYESAGRDDTAKQNGNGEWVWRGTTYDKTVYTAEVHVSVDIENEGQPNESQDIHADITYKDAEGNTVYREDGTTPADRVPFTNTYAVTSIEGSALQVQKTLDGRAMKDGEVFAFSWKLIAGDSAGVSGLSSEAKVTGDGTNTVGTSNFGKPTFKKPGTYTFQIEEQGTNGNGLTYDTHKATVTYVVNDSHPTDKTIAHTGNLRVESVTYNNAAALTEADRAKTGVAAFTNTYRTTKMFDGIAVSKTLNGRALVSGEFDFTITPQNQNAIDRKVASSDAKFSNTSNNASGVTENMTGKLASLTFTQADNGKDFTYLIGETKGSTLGVTYDTKQYHLTIHVSDDGNGNLTAKPTIKLADANGNPTGDEMPAAFVNEYVPADSNAVTPQLNKILTGRDWTNGETFTFNFEKVSAFVSGMSVDDALKIAPLPMKDGVETTSITLKGSEGLAGTKSGAAVPVDFGSLTFTKAGTYIYKATEVVPDDATNEDVKDANGKLIPYAQASDEQKEQAGWKKDGITYTVRPTLISVTVTDNTAEGKLEATVNMDNGGNFRNSYAASQSFDDAVNFQLTKTLNGHQMAVNQFQFNVTALDGVNANAAETAMKFGLSADGATTSLSVPGGEGDDGEKVVMSAGSRKANFTQADSGKTFKLQFDEVQPNQIPGGYTYDNAKYVMEVTPTDLGDGTMSIATKVTKTWTDAEGKEQSEVTEYAWKPGEDKATVSAYFVNKYESTGTIALSGTKTIGEPWTSGPAGFGFTVEQVGDANGDPMTADTVKAVLPSPATATSDANGNFTFGNITFSKPGTYYFKVTEIDGKIPGVGYVKDGVVVTVNVVEEDANGNGNGKLIATVAQDSPELMFTNTYTQTASAPYVPTISKKVSGHDAKAGKFSFQLIAADPATKAAIVSGDITGPDGAKLTVNQGTGMVETVANKTDIADGGTEGNITFSGLVFTKAVASPGYKFIVKEVVTTDDDGNGQNGVQNAGWTMDTHKYKINITVADKESKLVATATDDGTSSVFENSYNATGTLDGSVYLEVTKNLTGRDWADGDRFTFKLTANMEDANTKAAVEAGKITLPGNADSLEITDETEGYKAAFGDITFKQAGDFQFYITEQGKNHDGLTYDTTNHLVKVHVVDNGNGTLTATVEEGKNPTVTNVYTTGTANAQISVEKTFKSNGSDKEITDFSFVLLGSDGKQIGEPVFVNESGEASFPAITYTKDDANKTFTYTVKEVLPEGVSVDDPVKDGVRYDTDKETVTVTVTDNGNGTLTATTSGPAEFTNTYEVDGTATLTLVGKKTMENRAFTDSDNFSFTVKGESDEQGVKAPLPVGDNVKPNDPAEGTATVTLKPEANKTTADINYGTISFDESHLGHTFIYTVAEVNGGKTINGITYDKTQYKVTVTVENDGEGGVYLDVSSPQKAESTPVTRAAANPVTVALDFTNVYNSVLEDATETDATFIKVLKGRDWFDTDEFTFELKPVTDGAPMPKSDPNKGVTVNNNVATIKVSMKNAASFKDNAASFSFGEIEFTYDMVKDLPEKKKDFEYEVTEVKPVEGAIAGIDYSTNKATWTITVHDNGQGKLIATAEKKNTTFTNTYSSEVKYSADAGVELQKTLTGRDMTSGQFAFTLNNFSEGAAKKLGLKEDEVREVTAAAAGEASTINLFAGKDITFTNADDGAKYSFDVTETKKGTPEAGADGNGYTNDATEWHVEIAVAYDNATGVLTVTTTATAGGKSTITKVVTSDGKTSEGVATIPFVNEYKASTTADGGTSAVIEATKNLTGRPLEDGEFAFTLTGPKASGEKVHNQGSKVSFGTFDYTAAELEELASKGQAERTTVGDNRAWKLTYTASEVTDGFGNKVLTANRQSFPVTVTVVDNGNGSLTASVAYPAQGGNVFRNTYNAEQVTLSLNGKKFLEHADGLTPSSIEGKFAFTLTDEAGNTIATAKNDANGNVEFVNALTYTLDELNKLEPSVSEPAVADTDADESENAAEDKAEVTEAVQNEATTSDEGVDAQPVKREWLFTYYVVETGKADGVTNDAAAKKPIQVKVTDNGEGKLTAAVVKDAQALDFSFTNTYTVQPVSSSITDQLGIGKAIDGREMQAGEFAFEMLENGKQAATGKNTEAGTSSKVVFDAIKFTEPGEHDYTVREVDTDKGGVDYDGTGYQAHASVKDNGNGTLSVTWTFSAGNGSANDESATEGIVFKNTYAAKPTSIAFNAAKVLTGRDLKAGEFSFQLREGGKVLQTVKNGADGNVQAIKFDTIAYDQVGEHDYEIVEVKGNAANVTYDDTVFTYHVSVTDNGNGSLVATWTVGETGDPVFRNTYTEPKKPEPVPEPEEPTKPEEPGEPEEPAKPREPELPHAGDSMPAAGVLAAIAAAGAALVSGGVALIKRRR